MMLPAAAQDATSTTPTPQPVPPSSQQPTTIRQRDKNQQKRIGNGISNGELTPGEAEQLEGQEHKLNKEVRQLRKEDGGQLSAADKAKVRGQEHKMSQEIYDQKHDGQAVNNDPKTVGGRRAENQQDRIGQGLQSGQLSPEEAARLERQEGNIHREAHNMRSENGGRLTQEDKAKLNRQQDRESHRIYRAKHNGRTR
jgi:hypothetical protein